MYILWFKALHIFFMLAWMAGLFYLPRLFVYHATTKSQVEKDEFKVMERLLWFFGRVCFHGLLVHLCV